jgi:hypothetical protein
MKKFITILLLCVCTTTVFAQFKISGKIIHHTGQEKLKINIPQVYGFWEENSITIPVRKDGTFAMVLLINKQRFTNLTYQKIFHQILISPKKELVIEIEAQTNKVTIVGGSALVENKLLQTIDIDEFPYFLKEIETYHLLSYNELNSKVVVPYLAARDKKTAIINKAPISATDKKLIASEITYAAYNCIFDISGYSEVDNKPNINHMIINLFDKLNTKPLVFPAGPQYYIFARNYIAYMDIKAFDKINRNKINNNTPLPYYNMTLKAADELSTKYGKPYMRWMGSLKFLPDYITEIFTYQQITNLYYNNMPSQAVPLANAFIEKFPKSAYNADIKKKIAILLSRKAQ